MKYLSRVPSSYLRGKIALARLDFNTEEGDWRVTASLPTVKLLVANCRAVVILGHKGRPTGFDPALSLRQYAPRLKNYLRKPINFLPKFNFSEISKKIHSVDRGATFLLENLRFLRGESENSAALARQLASLGDFYVNDAFAVCHRKNASVTAIAQYLSSFAGLELEKEIKVLSGVVKKSVPPLVVVLGGAKVADKLGVWENLKNRAAFGLVGGGLEEKDWQIASEKLLLPLDVKKEKGLVKDIGPRTIKLFQNKIRIAKSIFWNGPVGDIRYKKYEAGTRAIAKAVAGNQRAYKVTGGGETVMFLKKMKLDKKMDFISTGGGAMLAFLAGKKLPGIEVLNQSNVLR